jgi:hypothetical protein
MPQGGTMCEFCYHEAGGHYYDCITLVFVTSD